MTAQHYCRGASRLEWSACSLAQRLTGTPTPSHEIQEASWLHWGPVKEQRALTLGEELDLRPRRAAVKNDELHLQVNKQEIGNSD